LLSAQAKQSFHFGFSIACVEIEMMTLVTLRF
jgi:hypothetical protein